MQGVGPQLSNNGKASTPTEKIFDNSTQINIQLFPDTPNTSETWPAPWNTLICSPGHGHTPCSCPMVLSDVLGAKISESIHSQYDTSFSSAHLNSFLNKVSTSMSIKESDTTAGIDSDISSKNSAPVRKCVDTGPLLSNSMKEKQFPLRSIPHASIHEEATQVEITHSHDKWNKPPPDLSDSKSSQENATPVTYHANEISIINRTVNSMPHIEQIPLISDDIVTPNLSQINDLEISFIEQESSTNDIDKGIKEKDVEDILVSVGYSPLVVGNILSSIKKGEVLEQKEVKCRPLTQIFTQGKVYTYPELEISKDRKIASPFSKTFESIT